MVRIKKAAGGGWAKVVPIDFPGREKPVKPTGVLTVEIIGFPDRRFWVKWKDVESIGLWENRIRRKTKQRIAQKDFNGAYPFLAVLMRDFPETAGLNTLRCEFLWGNAAAYYRQEKRRYALSVLEELRRFAPQYKSKKVLGAISGISDSFIKELVDRKQWADAQQILARLAKDYRFEEIKSLKKWDKFFRKMAASRMRRAHKAIAAKDFLTARKLIQNSLSLYPNIKNGRSLAQEINKQYPIVQVGVLQRATTLDPTRIDNWPARRAGRLVYHSLFQIQGVGPEGGQYDFLFGETEQSDDRMVFLLKFQETKIPASLNEISAYEVADVLVSGAKRDSSQYNSAWAGTVKKISVQDPKMLTCLLRRPHVLPESLLQLKVDGKWIRKNQDTPTNAYGRELIEPTVSRFKLRDPANRQKGELKEIIEVEFSNSRDAVAAILSRKVDIVDRLFPADAIRLARRDDVRIGRYPLPCVHMLIPCSDHAYLADRTFRRALTYAINRQDILEGELLEGHEVEGCQVVSGPFSVGLDQNDPLAYAYDTSITPRRYQPRLAKLLITMVQQQKQVAAKKNSKPIPELKPLRIAVPVDNISVVAVEAIKVQLELLQLFDVEIVEIPAGQTVPDAGTADMFYASIAVWEPVVDAQRILGPRGIAACNDQFIGLGLRQLESARNWRDVSNHLKNLHRICHNQLPVIPLWQLVDSYAYRTELTGVGDDIVSLYQNVNKWVLSGQ